MLNAKVCKDEEQRKLDIEIEGPVCEIMDDTCNLIRTVYSMLAENDAVGAAYYRTTLTHVVNGDKVWELIDKINVVKEA